MPQQVFCQNCNVLLNKSEDLVPPDEIIQRYDGKCPSCAKKLSLTPIKVEVRAVDTV